MRQQTSKKIRVFWKNTCNNQLKVLEILALQAFHNKRLATIITLWIKKQFEQFGKIKQLNMFSLMVTVYIFVGWMVCLFVYICCSVFKCKVDSVEWACAYRSRTIMDIVQDFIFMFNFDTLFMHVFSLYTVHVGSLLLLSSYESVNILIVSSIDITVW